MIRKEKEKVVLDLNKVFTEAKGIYLTDFTGINVETMVELRRQFLKGNINYRVVKNTLTRLSLQGLPYDSLLPYLHGPTGLVFSYEEALLPGKVIEGFQKKTELFPIKASIINGVVYDQSTTETIIKLPSRNELLAQMIGSLKSPFSGLVMVLGGVLRNVVGAISAIQEKQEKKVTEQNTEEQPETKAPDSSDTEEAKSSKAGTGTVEPEDEESETMPASDSGESQRQQDSGDERK